MVASPAAFEFGRAEGGLPRREAGEVVDQRTRSEISSDITLGGARRDRDKAWEPSPAHRKRPICHPMNQAAKHFEGRWRPETTALTTGRRGRQNGGERLGHGPRPAPCRAAPGRLRPRGIGELRQGRYGKPTAEAKPVGTRRSFGRACKTSDAMVTIARQAVQRAPYRPSRAFAHRECSELNGAGFEPAREETIRLR